MANGFLGLDSDALMAISAGLLSGRSTQEQLGNAATGLIGARKDARQRNMTMEMLGNGNPQLVQAVQAGLLSPADAFTLHYKQQLADKEAQLKAQAPSRKFQTLPNGEYGYFDENAGAWTPLGSAPKAGSGDGEEWGLNPVWGTDASGNTGIGQMSKSGKFKLLDTGEFKPSPGLNTIDDGRNIYTRDNRTGQTLSVTPKDLAGAEVDKAEGKGRGEALATYNSMMSKMPGLEQVVGELEGLADKATYTMAGRTLDAGMAQLGMDPRDAAIARAEYIAKVDNQILPLLRDTFGAQFTQKEGETLRATLGQPDITPAEKKAVLRAFIEQKRRDVEALARQSGGSQGGGQGASRTNSGVQWSIEP